MAATRLLCLGDLHLGRASGRVPASLPVDPATLTPRAAWRRAVAAARELGVQAVVLAGDVVDSANDRFEAFGALHDGVRELLAASIRVIAVAGNHDGVALPRLADLLDDFELLGRGGAWTTTMVDGPGGPLRVVGWSFPGPRHRADPTASGLPPRDPDVRTVGVLHTDLDAPGSPYAPTSSGRLRAAGYDAWLLGHVHAPSLDPATLAPGYLGSMVGLDPTETGPRGPWLLEAGPADVTLAMLPQAPLRWQRVMVDVTGIVDVDLELPERVFAALRDLVVADPDGWGEATAIGCRVELVGRTRRLDDVARCGRSDEVRGQITTVDGRALFVDDVRLAVDLDRDLAALAAESSPAGVLARRLLALETADDPSLLERIRDAIAEQDQRCFRSLAPPELSDLELRLRLLAAGRRALDALLARAEVERGPA